MTQWLQEHPGVEIISRDRGSEYREGASVGAPDAIQIADRFHLLQNLVDLLKRMFAEQPSKLREAARQVAEEKQTDIGPETEPIPPADEVILEAENPADQAENQTLRELRFAEVKELQAQNWSRRAIAKHLNIDARTVGKYFNYDSCPERAPAAQMISTVMPFRPDNWHIVPFTTISVNTEEVQWATTFTAVKDSPIVAAAEKSGVNYLVTLDKRHLLNKKSEIEPHVCFVILRPEEVLERLREDG